MSSPGFSFSIPGAIPSVANLREHWAVKAKRTASQRKKAMARCPKWEMGPLLVVTLTRVAPRELDDDNLRSSLKAIRDGIASRLGVDDKSKLVRWDYAYCKCPVGEECTGVEIWAVSL